MRGEHFAKTYSVSCLCSLAPDPLYLEARETINNQYDFFIFILKSIYDGYLVASDILVLDNCAIHGGIESFDVFMMVLKLCDIELAYLAAYSPEFSSCELVFAQVKRFLCLHRDQSISLDVDIACGFTLVIRENVMNYFNKCCRKYVFVYYYLYM